MRIKRGLSPSLEAIAFQSNGLLFQELTLAFTALEKIRNPTQTEVDAQGIPALVKRRTGMTVSFGVDPCPQPNAYVIPPSIDKNHALVMPEWRQYVGNKEGVTLANASKGALQGSVDLKTGMVSGVFTQITFSTFLTAGLLQSTAFTGAEKAAVYLHELGHLFTYCEFLGFTVTTNIHLHAATEAIFNEPDLVRKYQIVTEASKVLGVKFEDPDALVKIGNKEVLQTVILRETLTQTRSAMGSSIYDLTGWEALSDQFATRHGAGRDLVTALVKIHKGQMMPAYQSTLLHLILTAIKVVWFMLIVVGTWGVGLLLLMINPAVKLYDDPEARLSRIRRDMTAALKDRDLPAAARSKVLEDIEVIDAILEPINDKRGMLELLHTAVSPKGRRQYNQLQFQVDLEKLVNNDFFLTAAKLKALS